MEAKEERICRKRIMTGVQCPRKRQVKSERCALHLVVRKEELGDDVLVPNWSVGSRSDAPVALEQILGEEVENTNEECFS